MLFRISFFLPLFHRQFKLIFSFPVSDVFLPSRLPKPVPKSNPNRIRIVSADPFHSIKTVHQCSGLAELNDGGDKLAVIDFFAAWCGPCKMIEEMSKTLENVVFLKIDVDEAEDAAQEYNVSAMPTFIFIKNNAKVAELMGANAEKLKELIEKHA